MDTSALRRAIICIHEMLYFSYQFETSFGFHVNWLAAYVVMGTKITGIRSVFTPAKPCGATPMIV